MASLQLGPHHPPDHHDPPKLAPPPRRPPDMDSDKVLLSTTLYLFLSLSRILIPQS